MLRDKSLIPLSHQHHNGLALCVLTRQGLARDRSEASAARLARQVIERYEVELANHFEVEEQVLFPECGEPKVVAELVAEHRAMERMVEELRAAPSAEKLEEFCEMLSGHIRREERELFEQVQKALPRELLDRMGGEIQRRAVQVCLKPDPTGQA